MRKKDTLKCQSFGRNLGKNLEKFLGVFFDADLNIEIIFPTKNNILFPWNNECVGTE